MKKLILISILTMFVLSMNAFGSETRTLTLGQTNNVLLDENNIWLYPSRILDYPNLAIGEFGFDRSMSPRKQFMGGNDFQRFGVHFKIGRDNPWVLGAYFDNMGAFDASQGELPVFDDFDMIPDNRRINLFYGNRFGDMNFGARLGVYQSSVSYEDAAGEEKEAMSYYDLDLGLTAPDGAWDLAVNFALGGFTDEDAEGEAQNEKDGFFDFGLDGRAFYQVNPNYTLIPHASFMYNKRGFNNFDLDEDLATEDFSQSFTATMIQVGLGVNYTPATNVLAVADFGLAWAKEKAERTDSDPEVAPDVFEYEDETSQLWLPYFKLGLDADVFKWMDVRFGVRSIWNRASFEDKLADETFNVNFADNQTYLGFGFHWGRLHVDTYTDPELFLDGFNFISGEDTDMNFQISAVYEMM